MTDERIKELELKANNIRISIIDMLEDAGSGHTAGPLGMTDVFTALYFEIMTQDPKKPDWDERDRLILSNGHIVPVRYAAMAHAGYFPLEELSTLRKFGSRLQGHPERHKLPGIENTAGPLGTGLGQAAGMAFGLRMDGLANRVYCLTGDGELDCGNIWESAMFAAHHNLSNLTAIVDRNNIQINGNTENVMKLGDIKGKWESFGWHVIEIDGHNMQSIVDAIHQAHAIQEQPCCIIANTIPGKGIKEIENKFDWHGKPPTQEEEQRFLKELRTLQGKIEGSHSE